MLGLLKRRSPLSIVEISPEMYRDCADIHAGSFARSWSDGTIGEMLAGKGMAGLAARTVSAPKAIQAFLIYRVVGRECEIITIATASGSRRRGAARALLAEMIRRCLTDRLEEVFLEVDETNEAAIRLYRSLGFNEVGKRKAYYSQSPAGSQTGKNSGSDLANAGRPAHDACIMKLDLRD